MDRSFNDTRCEYPMESCIHEQFELQAKIRPDQTAVYFPMVNGPDIHSKELTYGELNRRADVLAQRLMKEGVKENAMVALYMDRSIEMVVALLGILKAGCAYVPLDPAYPVERIVFMLKDTEAPLIITQSHLTANLPDQHVPVLMMDDDWGHDEAVDESRPASLPQKSGSIAYINYTSGSTGRPKGVKVPHRGVLRLVIGADYTLLDENQNLLQLAPISFDAATFEIWGSLLLGGKCVLFPYNGIPEPQDLKRVIDTYGITRLWLTASLFNLIIDVMPESLYHAKEVLTGGEALSVPHIRKALKLLPDTQLVNGYGPTESTTFTCCYRIPKELKDDVPSIPIGHPISNTQVYIFDSSMKPVPVMEEGELYIGGDGLAEGYLNLPEMTSERFIQDPYHPGERLYKTGDIVRLLPEGEIEFVGRFDDQVKINGFRIELGEIEASLKKHPDVRDALVLAEKDETGTKFLLAFITPVNETPQGIDGVKEHLQKHLTQFMIPRDIVWVDKIPLNPNGKADRQVLIKIWKSKEDQGQAYAAPRSDIERTLSSIWSEVLNKEKVSIDSNFFEIGGTSILSVRLMSKVGQAFNKPIPITKLFHYPTIKSFARYLDEGEKTTHIVSKIQDRVRLQRDSMMGKAVPCQANRALMSGASGQDVPEGIAVIGMVGRFPGAPDVDRLWENLVNGVESVTFFSESDLDPMIGKQVYQRPDYVKARGIIDDADKFDASFFGVNGMEAAMMDPQQRVFMELSWHALENAGYNPETYDGLIGLFAGMNNNTYFKNYVATRPDKIDRFGDFQTMLANEKDFLTTRVSYRLNLTGPSVNVFTACSTSLVAVCHAFDSLLKYQCDMALAGGISITFPQRSGYYHQEGNILSGDGHCRPFDDQSSGTTFSDGAGIVVLKRLSEAIADKDHIYAVIKGNGVNNDGDRKVSFTAPSVSGQAEAIAMAQVQAGVDPRTISYIETHGTGTKLGDPIEIEALTQVFKEQTPDTAFCGIGSVKSNFGHLVHAAGVAGLIKTVLALKHQVIPPTINYKTANREIDFDHSPFYVVDRLTPWDKNGHPRRAGVSSFGVGGTNAHVVLEEAPAGLQPVISGKDRLKPQLLLVSGESQDALDQATANIRAYVENNRTIPLAHVAYTLQQGRKHFSYRRFIVCDESTVVETLGNDKTLQANSLLRKIDQPPVVFMFPGQGAQYEKMGMELYESDTVYRYYFDLCSGYLKPHMNMDLSSILYGPEGTRFTTEQLRETRFTQPALFAVEYAMARMMIECGVLPSAMIGHSVGEFVAACLAGVFSLEDACFLIANRSRVLQDMPHGSMMAVRLPEKELIQYLTEEISIAAVNSPSLCVASGETDNIRTLNDVLESERVVTKLLNTSHAFHSHMVNPAVEQFEGLIRNVTLSRPNQPFVSTVSGTWITDDQATSHRYWAEHMRHTVRFSDGLQTLLTAKDQILLEIGPGSTLTVISNQMIPKDSGNKALSLIGGKSGLGSETERVLQAIGQLWLYGRSFDWNVFHPEDERCRVPLPGYPFERKRYWIDRMEPTESNGTLNHQETLENEVENSMTQNSDGMATVKRGWLTDKTMELLEDISGEVIEPENIGLSFFEIGFDSLFLTQASIALKNEFDIEISFRQLIEDYTSVQDLVEFLMTNVPDDKVPGDLIPAAQPSPAMPQTIVNTEHIKDYAAMNNIQNTGAKPVVSLGGMNDLFSRQLAIIEKQLELLNNPGVADTLGRVAVNAGPEVKASGAAVTAPVQPAKTEAPKEKDAAQPDDPETAKRFSGPQLKIRKTAQVFSPKQQAFFEEFSKRYIAKTKGSKDYTARHRAHLADPRAVSGFSPTFKELVYPIVTKRSKGCKLWDLDDNEYVDMLNGFGSNFFGFSAPFVSEAIKAQIDKGIEIGPQHELAGEVAEMICKVTKFDRAAFCNTGSEAVLGALRIARTITGRNLAAMFTGGYHGIFNEVINRGKKDYTSIPAAPGITKDSTKNMLVFDYGTQETLDAIRERASQIAAILVEPVQSRAPELQPKEFLHELRKIADENNIVLIFDEVVTGFRACLGGSQQHFGIKADLATYGKVIGGGWPIGVIAGKTKYMDALDGGAWQYGDASIPEVGVTYFAGTFVRHPPALAVIKAVLTYLEKEGPELYERINKRCTGMVDRLNGHLSKIGAPVQIRHFTSVMKVEFTEEVPYEEMLFLLLREKGIHIWHHRPCFMTLAHTDEDIDRVIKAFVDSVKELQAAEFLPNRASAVTDDVLASKAEEGAPPIPGARLGKDPQGNPAWFIKDPDRPGKYLQVGGSITQ